MRKWKERIISLLLVVSMVVGLVQMNPMSVQAAVTTGELQDADGVIWLTKNGDNVSDEFSKMVQNQLKLDDMVRDALGITDSKTNVYFEGVNVGNAMELLMSMDKVESMVDEMTEAIRDKKLVVFHVGSPSGKENEREIAFRNMASAVISAGENNIIYVDHPGAPADADALEDLIADALNKTVVSVEDAGVVSIQIKDKLDITKNKTRIEVSGFQSEGGASYKSLLRKWPSSAETEKKAGEVIVAIKAAEYSQYPEARFTKTVAFDVIMRDQRVTVNAAAKDKDGNLVFDPETSTLNGFTASYSGNDQVAPKEKPELKHYEFVKWEKGCCEGYAYTAIMKAKTDNNGNGLADQLEPVEEHTVKYYVGTELWYTETVSHGGTAQGPDTDPEYPGEETDVKLTWVTAEGAAWQAFVYGDIEYYAEWTVIDSEEPVNFTATGTLMSEGKTATQELSVVCINPDENLYQVADPGWKSLMGNGYEFKGWYYKVDNEEVSVDLASKVWDADEEETVALFCEFLPKVVVNKPNADYGTTDEVTVSGSKKVYTYSIETADGTKYVTCFDEPDAFVASDYDVFYDENNTDRLHIFNGWIIPTEVDDVTEYTITPDLTDVVNTISLDTDVTGVFGDVDTVKDYERVTYTIDNYKAYVDFDCGEGEDNEHTYAVDAETVIMVSPFRNDSGDILYYVTGLKAYDSNGREANIPVTEYDESYNAYIEGVYSALAGSMRSGAADKLTGVEVVPQYEMLQFKDSGKKLPAGKEKSEYTEQKVFEQVVKTNLSYSDSAVTIKYKAQEAAYEINLYKLYELFEADGLGALKSLIGDQYDSLEVYPTEDTWKDISTIYDKEVTAQEAADAYLVQEYKKYKENPDTDIFQFINNVVLGLGEAVYNNAHHKFGNVAPGDSNPKEELKIEYVSDPVGASLELSVSLDDKRIDTTITGKDVTCTYGDKVIDKIMSNAVLSDGINKALCITYDAKTGEERDFSSVGAGTYDVQIAFKGDTDYKPVISNSFKLTVKQVEDKNLVTVEKLISVIRGNDYYNRAAAKVKHNAPIVQIVAGIASDELAYGLNTEGSVEDWTLGFDDETLMADVWVKLPQSYIELLKTLELKDLKPYIEDAVGDVELPENGKIVPGTYYTIEDIEKALEEHGYKDNVENIEQVKQLQAIIDEIPDVVMNKLGINDLKYGVKVRFDALEAEVYPTAPGVYANYAATLSRFNNSNIKFDNNFKAAEDYGFIVISPMVPIPNRGGVQLYDGTISNAQNVFVYEYDGTDTVRDLEVAVKGKKLDGETPFYYGLNTRMDATQAAPKKPGVYFAGYNYFTEVKNEDSGEMEVRRLGSDSAIIIIKQREADLTITGGIYEYEEVAGKPVNKIAEVKITDKNGNVINDKGVTVISGTVNVKDDGTNVSANDLYGTVNVDLPDALQAKWSAFCTEKGYDSDEKIRPSDLITFLEICRDTAKKAADTALDGFKAVAMKDAVSSALDKINGKQSYVDVSTGNLVNKANRVQDVLNNGVAYYNRLLEQLEPLKDLDDNLLLTFYDLKTQSANLEYGKTGYYLYMGVITDPDLTVGVAKGLVVIHSADDYVMYDTHVPYNGKPQSIVYDDTTCRGDVSVMVDRQANEITFFLDNDVYKAVNAALEKVPNLDASLNEGSDVNVSTVYKMTGKAIDKVTEAIVDQIEATLIAKIKAKYPTGSEKLTNALNKVPGKVSNMTAKVTSKLEELDKLPDDTRIIFYNKSTADDLQGMPVNAGTYEFYGYDYDVSATRGKLVIEPIYIMVEDGIDPVTGEEIVVTKTDNEDDPDLRKYVSVTYHSFAGVAPAAKTQVDVELPAGVTEADVVEYVVTRTEANNRVVGTYDMSVTATLLADSRNYKLAERTEDVQDFKVVAEVGTITRGEWRMELDSVVYLNYYPTLNDFSENFDFADKSRAGVVIWTGDKAPTNGKYVVVDGENTMKIEGWMQNSKGEWYVQTPEIYAKNLGDMWYIRPYVVDKDGEYVYLNGVEYYSPKYFAYDVMNEADRAEDEKYVCASLLQYGASAQIHFGYHDDKDNPLVNIIPARDINGRKYTNVSWDDYDLEYYEAYEDEIVITPDIIELAGTLAIDEYYAKGITYNKSALDLAGAIRLSVGFEIDTTTIDPTQIKKQEVLFWNERDFENADTLAYSAATYNYKCDLVKATGNEEVNLGSYRGKSDHIVAKYLGEAVFFTCRIEMNDGTVYNSGLWYYSPEEFAADHIDESTGTVVDVSKRIIVYSEMAERCFIKNKK